MTTSHRRLNGRITATLTVNRPGDIRLFMLQLEHELGHALFGLAHDAGISIMNPHVGEGEEAGFRVWRLTEKDRAALLDLLEMP